MILIICVRRLRHLMRPLTCQVEVLFISCAINNQGHNGHCMIYWDCGQTLQITPSALEVSCRHPRNAIVVLWVGALPRVVDAGQVLHHILKHGSGVLLECLGVITCLQWQDRSSE